MLFRNHGHVFSSTMDLQTTKTLLRKHHFRPNKLRGQSFLVDPWAAEQIVAAAQLSGGETVLEVGPGLGALTVGLLAQAGRVVAVELDAYLCAILKAEIRDQPKLELIHTDFLKVNIPELVAKAGSGGLKIVGNLPYHITGQAVRMILDHLHLLRLAVITVQSEVADRILARPGGKTFGVLSVATQYHSHPKSLLRLSKEAFYPRPQVTSTVLALIPRSEPPLRVADEALFFTVVKALFGHRRKMARNALRAHPDFLLSQEEMAELSRRSQMDLGRRAETMSLDELGRLSNALWEMRHA